VRKPSEEDEIEYNAIQLTQIDPNKVKDTLIITIIDSVTDIITDYIFENPLPTQEKPGQMEFESYNIGAIWTLVSFMHEEKNSTIKDIASKYDGEVIYIGGDTKYYDCDRKEIATDIDFRLIFATTY